MFLVMTWTSLFLKWFRCIIAILLRILMLLTGIFIWVWILQVFMAVLIFSISLTVRYKYGYPIFIILIVIVLAASSWWGVVVWTLWISVWLWLPVVSPVISRSVFFLIRWVFDSTELFKKLMVEHFLSSYPVLWVESKHLGEKIQCGTWCSW